MKLRYYVDNFETYGKGSLSQLDFGLIESDIKLKNMDGRLSFRDNSLLYKKYGLDLKGFWRDNF